MRVAHLVLERAWVRAVEPVRGVVLGTVPERALADVLEIVHKRAPTGADRGVQQTVLGHARVALERALI